MNLLIFQIFHIKIRIYDKHQMLLEYELKFIE